MIDSAHRDLVGRVDEIVQLWRMGAETSVLGERVQAFRDAAENYYRQKIEHLPRVGGRVLTDHAAEHAEMIGKVDAVLSDFAVGDGALHWFEMVEAIGKALRHYEEADGRIDAPLMGERTATPQETLIGWTSDLSVGVDWVDQHHRALIDTINEIGMLPKNYDLADADALLERLRRITWYHFHEEEARLAQNDRDRVHRHVAQHRNLLAELDRLIFDVRSRRVDLTGETSAYLCRWLIDHIQTIDKQDFQALPR